jgi:hypothetical protein
MKSIQIKKQSIIKAKGFDISIGREVHQIALISHSTNDFTPFKAIKKKGRLYKIKRKFKSYLSSSTHFFFEYLSEQDSKKLISILS